MIAWEWAAAMVALVALVFRQRGVAAAFAAPLIVRLIWPELGGSPAIVVAVLMAALFCVGVLARFFTFVLGPEVAGHVVGEYTIRCLDGLFRRRPD